MKYLVAVLCLAFASMSMAAPNISHHNNSVKGDVKSNIHNSNKNSNSNKNANYNGNKNSNKNSNSNYNKASINFHHLQFFTHWISSANAYT